MTSLSSLNRQVSDKVTSTLKAIEKILVGGRDEVTIGREMVMLLKDTNNAIRGITATINEEAGAKCLAKMRDLALVARELITLLLQNASGVHQARRKKVLCVTIRVRANQLQRYVAQCVDEHADSLVSTTAPPPGRSQLGVLQVEERIDASDVAEGDDVDVEAELDDALSTGNPSPRSPPGSPSIGTDRSYSPQWKSPAEKAEMMATWSGETPGARSGTFDSGITRAEAEIISPMLLEKLSGQLGLSHPAPGRPLTLSVLITSNPDKTSDILRHAASALTGERPSAPPQTKLAPPVPLRESRNSAVGSPLSTARATSAAAGKGGYSGDRAVKKGIHVGKLARSKTLKRLGTNRGMESPQSSTRDVEVPRGTSPNPEADIQFTSDRKPRVAAATPARLVQYLTAADNLDVEFRKAFLLTFRGFMSAHEVIDMLRARFTSGAADARTVQLRVITVLKMWASNYHQDFEDKLLLEKLQSFVMREGSAYSDAFGRIVETLKSKMFKDRKRASDRDVSIMQARSLLRGLSLDDVPPIALAEQLTLLDIHYYRRVQPKELMNQSWNSKSDGRKNSPNVLASIDRFNMVSKWIITRIVSQVTLTDRTAVLTRFVRLGKCFLDMNNFNGVFCVMGALGSSSISRLKKTWAGLDKDTKTQYDAIVEIANHESNYKTYRDLLHSCCPPCLPYIGVYLTDLTFIEEGNPNTVRDGLINWVKREMIARVIEEMVLYQSVPFQFKEDLMILTQLEGLEHFDENEAYRASLRIEPRNTDEALETMLMEADKAKCTVEQLQVRIADMQATIQDLQMENRTLAEELAFYRQSRPRPSADDLAQQRVRALPPAPGRSASASAIAGPGRGRVGRRGTADRGDKSSSLRRGGQNPRTSRALPRGGSLRSRGSFGGSRGGV